MYQEHSQFETPPDEVSIWRYMDVARFIALIESKTLYFATVRELGDPWKAPFPPVRKVASGSR